MGVAIIRVIEFWGSRLGFPISRRYHILFLGDSIGAPKLRDSKSHSSATLTVSSAVARAFPVKDKAL